jgi:hypothetical protein
MHDQLTRLEVWRHHREELLREAENARLAREARRRRREAPREWKINLGGWTLQLRRIPDYERLARPPKAEKPKPGGRRVAHLG